MAIHILEPWMEGTCPGWRSSFTRKPQAWWRKCQWIGKLFIHATPHIKPSPRGVLLVDRSGGSARQVLEITSEECKWRARKQGGERTAVKNEETVSVPDGKDYLSGFHVSRMVAPNGHKACPSQSEHQGRQGRQHHNINLKFVMKQRRGFDSVCYRIPGCTRRTAWSPQPPQPHTGTIFWFASSKLCASQHMFFCTLTDGLFFQHPNNFGSLKLDCIEDSVIFWKEHLGSWFDSVFFAGATFALWMVNSEWHGPSVPSRPPLTQSLPSRACGRTGWCAETCLISLLS